MEFDMITSVHGDSLEFSRPLNTMTKDTFFFEVQLYFENHIFGFNECPATRTLVLGL